MSFIDNIRKNRRLDSLIPLWKLNLTDDETVELVNYIKQEIKHFLTVTTHYGKDEDYKTFDRELCLLYAIWWNTQYSVGVPTWNRVLLDYGFSSEFFEIVKDAVTNELRDRQRLQIPIYQTENNTNMYFYSLLAQGGLPMSQLTNDVFTSFENFLDRLIEEYEEVEYNSWSDLSRARLLAKQYLQSQTLANSDAVLLFANEIVKAFLEHNDTMFDNYAQIQRMIVNLRNRRKGSERKANTRFMVNWEFSVRNEDMDLCYTVTVPKELNSVPHADENVSIVDYYLQNRLLASYHKQGDIWRLMPGSYRNSRYVYDQFNTSLSLKCKVQNSCYDSELFNAVPPSMDEPFEVQYSEGVWVPKSIRNNQSYACIIPQNWVCNELMSAGQPMHLAEYQFTWLPIDWNDYPDHSLTFTNKETNEIIVLNDKVSNYKVSFKPLLPLWMEDTSALLCFDNEDLRRRISLYCSDNSIGENLTINVKDSKDDDYRQYRGGELAPGPVKIRIQLPDTSQTKNFTVYHIIGLKYTRVSNKIFRLNFKGGRYDLLKNQDCVLKDGNFVLSEIDNGNSLHPIRFRLSFSDSLKHLEVSVTSPRESNCFLDGKGNILPENMRLSVDELYLYKINLSERSKIVVSLVTRKHRNAKLRKEITLDAGRYSLDVLSPVIERFICIYGDNDYEREIEVRIHWTHASLILTRHAFRGLQFTDDTRTYISVRHSNIQAEGLVLHALPIDVSRDSNLFMNESIILDERDPGCYYLPELTDSDATKFIVFSDNTKTVGSMLPIYFDIDRPLDPQERKENARRTIEESYNRLTGRCNDPIQTDNEWTDLWKYMSITIRYQLTYNQSFNCFRALSSDPDLLAEFLFRLTRSGLPQQFSNETILSELQRMEKELSFGFHYLPIQCWQPFTVIIFEDYQKLVAQDPELAKDFGLMDYLRARLKYFLDLSVEQFGDDRVFGYLTETRDNPNPENFADIHYYLEQIHDAFEDFTILTAPYEIAYLKVGFHPLRLPIDTSNILQRLQYMAIVLPQCAAQYAFGADSQLWQYKGENAANQFLRRMINYMRLYTPNVYNKLFTIAIQNKPIKQNS